MALTKIALKPGINKDDSGLAAEGGWIDGDRVRFQGAPQVIGGWEQVNNTTFQGIARGAHAWSDLDGKRYFAWGTQSNLYVCDGTSTYDISPEPRRGHETLYFFTTNGQPTVTFRRDLGVNMYLHVGDVITFANATPTTIGGVTLAGAHVITAAFQEDGLWFYSYVNGSNATSTTYPTGLTSVLDWAIAPGAGAQHTTGMTSTTLARVWSIDNLGERLQAVPRGYGLYEWDPDTFQYLGSGAPDALLLGLAGAAGYASRGTGWSAGFGGVLNAAAGTASQTTFNFTEVNFVPEKLYKVIMTVTNMTAGTVYFLGKNGGTNVPFGLASTVITKNGTYTWTFSAPVGLTHFAVQKDNAFDGTISVLTVRLVTTAYPIEEAPAWIDSMFVDEKRIVTLLGTVDLAGVYNPMYVRWSDIENNREWTPTSSNLSGDYVLSTGSRIVSGLVSRRQNLIWSDDALYTMTFQGDSNVVYSFELIDTGVGLIGKNAVASYAGTAYWMGARNFYLFNGVSAQVIATTVTRDIFDHIDDLQEEKIFCGINNRYNEIWWFYPDSRDLSNINREPGRYVALNLGDMCAMTGTMQCSSWIPAGIFGYPIGFAHTNGESLGIGNKPMYHEKGLTANGSALNPYVETAWFNVGDGEFLQKIDEIMPDFDDQVGDVKFRLSTKTFPNATATTFGTYVASTTSGPLRMRLKARQAKLRVFSDATSSFWKLGAVALDIEPTGAKR